jgi:hypothetical protein
MIIDPNTGNLLLGIESVGPTLTEKEFIELALGESAARVRKTETRNWYEIWRPGDSGRAAGVVIGFAPGGEIQQARIKLVKDETRAAGVSGWSREVENEIKEFHDGLLRRQLGDPPYDFRWGQVSSVIDQHDYSAIIIVTFKPKR